MDKRQQRDFNAGLSAEVDAFLRGEPTRRDFIKQFGQMSGMLAISAGTVPAFVQDALAQAAVDLADASHAARQGPGGRDEGLHGRAGRRLGLPGG